MMEAGGNQALMEPFLVVFCRLRRVGCTNPLCTLVDKIDLYVPYFTLYSEDRSNIFRSSILFLWNR